MSGIGPAVCHHHDPHLPPLVIPAQTGIKGRKRLAIGPWAPACNLWVCFATSGVTAVAGWGFA